MSEDVLAFGSKVGCGVGGSALTAGPFRRSQPSRSRLFCLPRGGRAAARAASCRPGGLGPQSGWEMVFPARRGSIDVASALGLVRQ